MAVEGVEYTAKQVAAHRDADDAWMTIHGQVYDVTKYLHDHPGGLEVLLETAGTDASEAFDSAGHSEDAVEIMADYRVGSLRGYRKKAAPRAVRPVVINTTSTGNALSVVPGTTLSLRTTAAALGATAAAAGAVALVYALGPRGHLPALLSALGVGSGSSSRGPSASASASSSSSRLGFLEGLLVATALFGAAGGMASRRALALLHAHPSFMNYAPHVKVGPSGRAAAAEENVLGRADGWLHPTRAQPLALTRRELVAPDTWRLVFDLPTADAVLGLPTGQHVAVTGTVAGGAAVTRSYTPVSNNADRGRLELLVKMYADGALTGGLLAHLAPGDEVLFRGPRGAMRYRRGLARRMGMLAGGSGITPMWQLIRAVCEDARDTTELSLVYANRTEDDILLRAELDAFARRYPRNFKVHYMLDRPPPPAATTAGTGWQGGVGYVTRDVMAERFPPPDADSKILICGPPGMVGAAKKALVELGFEKPGAMSKMTDQVFCF
ncbi:ferredoxin reductase-like protein [Xylariaceae sp. FL0804]|nr:ferredoxin reductase-like protein [Xylariaceae sp. FL0804]